MKSSMRKVESAKPMRAVEWDEKVIAEHDLERGTRMTIDEPPTPYSLYNEASDDEAQNSQIQKLEKQGPQISHEWDDLKNKLNKVAELKDKHGDDGHLYDSPPQTPELRKKQSDAFSKKVKAHYNEIEALKRFRASHPNGLDDDEDEDKDDEVNIKKEEKYPMH